MSILKFVKSKTFTGVHEAVFGDVTYRIVKKSNKYVMYSTRNREVEDRASAKTFEEAVALAEALAHHEESNQEDLEFMLDTQLTAKNNNLPVLIASKAGVGYRIESLSMRDAVDLVITTNEGCREIIRMKTKQEAVFYAQFLAKTKVEVPAWTIRPLEWQKIHTGARYAVSNVGVVFNIAEAQPDHFTVLIQQPYGSANHAHFSTMEAAKEHCEKYHTDFINTLLDSVLEKREKVAD